MRSARGVRRAGFVPAVLYGHGVENVSLAVEAKALAKLLPTVSSSTLLTLTIGGADARRVLIQEVQRDPLSGEPTHVDFHQVKLTEKIRARVPLRPEGTSPAVKDQGGVLVQSMESIEVEALPEDLPADIMFDVSVLAAFEDRLTVADLPVPANVEAHAKPEEIVAVVQPPKSEDELKAELEAPAEEVPAAEVKTEAELKKAAEETQKAEEAAVEGKEPAGKPAENR